VSSSPADPDWLPLDNAAKIYPTASSKLSPAVFRLSARLRAPIKLTALQRAADALVRRCPLYSSGLLRLSWSLVVLGCIVPLIGLLLYAQYRLKATRDDIRKIFHM